ncbi:MAG: HAMP domain-containing protein [Anaerolineae bacterium]|nr:HAMP domain-containing protein [Anaerolineae bacterium]
MRFQLLGEWGKPYFEPPQRLLGFLLLSIYGLILVILFVRIIASYVQRRQEFRGTWTAKALWLIAWLVLSVLLANTFIVEWPVDSISKGLAPGREALALFAFVPITIAAAQFGAGGAMLAGLASGWVSGAYDTTRLTQIFEIGALGLLVSLLLYQDYKGRLGYILRQPLIAVPWAGMTIWLLGVFSIYAYTNADLSTLSAVNNSITTAIANLPVVLVKSLIAGAILQIAYALLPKLRAVQIPTRIPPYARSISLRFLFFFLPAAALTLAIILYAMMAQSLRIATDQTISQVAHVARNVSIQLPFFPWTGQSLLSWIATDAKLQSAEYKDQEAALKEGMKTMPFFNQIALVEKDDLLPDGQESGQLTLRIVGAPPESQMELMVTEEEMDLLKLTLRDGSIQITPVHKNWNEQPIISFIVPVASQIVGGEIVGALIGRVHIADNFQLQGMINNLQPPSESDRNRGIGFLVDEQNRIVADPDTARILGTWTVNADPLLIHETDNPLATVYEDRHSLDGTRQLVYVLRTEGVLWRIVVIRPYENVLTQATEISSPLLILFMVAGVIASISVPIFTAQLTRPLQRLSQAASEIADNRLDIPVNVAGEDEVGQLGRSFEQMRQRLQERMSELSLLLEISQKVSASIELEPSLMPILEGAVQATEGVAARMILLDAHGVQDKAINYGQLQVQQALIRLDGVVDTIVKRNKELAINDITHVGPSTLVDLLRVGIHAVVGLPLRLQDRVTGVLWVCYAQGRAFDDSDMRFLYTLAGQAAVVAANARLFEDVQQEQSRLKAILNSTNDVVIVVDGQERVLLSNPAAHQTYGLVDEDVIGRPAQRAIPDKALLSLLTRPMEQESALTDEVHAPDGRTFSASVSSLSTGGRVVTLRDITYLKELDQMKSDFVNTVSHDLRSPLTYMRGYTTMIPMVGEVNDKQQGFVEKIIGGIEQMTVLIDDLLDIGKIEAGVGVEIERCWLPGVIQAVVDDLGGRAAEKQIKLNASLPLDVPPTMADNTLVRQAIQNLVDNALKYTPGPGQVDVLLQANNDFLIVRVRDTGIGIATEHQRRLFEKFYRIKRRDTVHIKGTGLGLAIVKSIAERHKGRVWIESKLGEGSTFYFAIPLISPDEQSVRTTDEHQ